MPFSGDLQGFFLLKVLHRDAERYNDKDLRMALLTAGLLLLMLLVSNSGRDERAKRGRCCCFLFTTLHMTGGNFSNMFPVLPGRVCTACDAIRWLDWAKSSHSQEDAPVCEGAPSDCSRFFLLTFHKAAGQIWKYSCSWAKESTLNFLSGR